MSVHHSDHEVWEVLRGIFVVVEQPCHVFCLLGFNAALVLPCCCVCVCEVHACDLSCVWVEGSCLKEGAWLWVDVLAWVPGCCLDL